jgi:cyclohexyl-isocyanide hydratase
MKMHITMILFNKVTILDFAGPYEIFTRVKDWEVHIVTLNPGTIHCEGGMKIAVEESLNSIQDTDILFIPGGTGINDVIQNKDFLKEIKRLGDTSKYITSVCTGSLALATAGLLDGYKATTHWRSLPFLQKFPIELSKDRVVVDRNRITAGGITSGIDFGLELISRIEGERTAQEMELWIEYNPKPPFRVGHPSLASDTLLQKVQSNSEKGYAIREEIFKNILK